MWDLNLKEKVKEIPGVINIAEEIESGRMKVNILSGHFEFIVEWIEVETVDSSE